MPFPVDEKYIEAAEKELGGKFPKTFRSKMQRSNGGEVEIQGEVFFLYPFYDTSDRKHIVRTCNSIVHETKKEQNDFGLPDSIIAIGDNGGGDLLVYKISPEGQIGPQIYWRDHTTGELNFVSDDFSCLIVD